MRYFYIFLSFLFLFVYFYTKNYKLQMRTEKYMRPALLKRVFDNHVRLRVDNIYDDFTFQLGFYQKIQEIGKHALTLHLVDHLYM